MNESGAEIMNKVTNRNYIQVLWRVIFFIVPLNNYAQDSTLNKYGLYVINSKNTYEKSVKSDPHKRMIDLANAAPGIIFDLRYTTTNNFMQVKLYPFQQTSFMRKKAAESIIAIQKELSQQGLSLKIFDAYRPYAITEKMWEMVKDDRYAADPKKGSGHNRGIAVDLTIVDIKTKEELDMGTGFDNFTDSAHHDFKSLPHNVLQNRKLLKSMMEKHGFKAMETEWWHYMLPNANDYELLDLSFETLKQQQSY